MRSVRYRRSSLYRISVFGLTALLFLGVAAVVWVRSDVSAASAFATPAFQTQWQQGEGIVPNFWGPLANAKDGQQEPYANAPGGQRLVQYFDKGRMELTNPATGVVTSGLLASELVKGQIQVGDSSFQPQTPPAIAIAGDPSSVGATYLALSTTAASLLQPAQAQIGVTSFNLVQADGTVRSQAISPSPATNIGVFDSVTQHNVPTAFVQYREKVGFLNIGYAISEPFNTTVNIAGQPRFVTAQIFERRALTYTASNPADFQVEMGNIGLHYYQWRYSGPVGPTPTSVSAITVSSPTVSALTDTSVVVTFTTNVPTCAVAQYRVTGTTQWGGDDIANVACDASIATTTHSRNLTGISPNATIDVRGAVKDLAGNIAYSASVTFTTNAAPTATATTAAATATSAPTNTPEPTKTPAPSPTPGSPTPAVLPSVRP